jgi:peptidoglycan/LPS O-acetylase OafA/YrhL
MLRRVSNSARPSSRSMPLSIHEKVDICRGLFAALVVVAHGLQVAWAVHPEAPLLMSSPVRGVWVSVFENGIVYVMGFFVISGYCIHLSVSRLLGGAHFPMRQYLVARLSRILPLYYAALLFAVFVEWLIADARPYTWPHGINPGVLVAQLFMVQNLTQTYGAFAPSWSITNEVFYYVFYGLLACVALRRTARPAWIGMGICVAVACVAQLLYVTIAHTPVVYSAGELLGLGIIWFQGVLVAIFGKELVARRWVRIVARFWPLVLGAVFVWSYFQFTPHGVYLLSGWAFTLMLLQFHEGATASPRPETAAWRRGVIETFGLTSYPMYLFHAPLMMFAGSLMMRWGVVTDWRATWLLLVALGLGTGVLLGWFLERPIMNWRSSMLKRVKERDQGRGLICTVPSPAMRSVLACVKRRDRPLGENEGVMHLPYGTEI